MTFERQLQRLESAQAQQARQSSVAAPKRMNIVEFAVSVLGLPLFPMQGLVLKLVTLATELLTPWDLEMIKKLSAGYRVTDDGREARYAGTSGMPPDVLARVDHCKARGRWAFRQIVLVLGRRASKSTMGAIVCLWQLWNLLALGDPQRELGLPPRKRVMIAIFSTSLDASSRDLFGDVTALLLESAAFAPFVDRVTATRLRLFSPEQLRSGALRRGEAGLLEVRSVATTARAARGPALVALILDEFAYVTGTGSTSDATGIVRSAAPALAQFRQEGFTFMASTPASMTGGFFEAAQDACLIEPETCQSAYPDTFLLQLPSWAMSEGWEIADQLPLWPSGPHYATIKRPIVLEDDPEVVSTKRRDPWSYRGEFRAEWVGSVDAYLTPTMIDGIFAAYRGAPLQPQSSPTPGRTYVIHIDPSSVGDNTVAMVAHAEDLGGVRHVVVDLQVRWSPSDFGGEIPYQDVAREVGQLINLFDPVSVTIDQHSGVPLKQMIDREIMPQGGRSTLNAFVGRVRVVHAGGEKMGRYERFKLEANERHVHAPYDHLLRDELTVLERRGDHVGAPTSGSVQTDDCVDALTWVVQMLTDGTADVSSQFAATSLHAMALPSTSTVTQQFNQLTMDSRRARLARGESRARGGDRGR